MSKWEKVSLGEIGDIVTGNTPPTKHKEYYISNDIQFYKPNDFKELIVNKLEKSTAYVSKNAKEKIRFLPSGSVLTTCIGIIGKVGVLDHAATCNQQINAIIPDYSKIEPRFLAYCILSKNEHLKNTANAPIVPIINKTQFSKVDIHLPSLDVQKKITKTLDTVSELIALRKKQLAELDDLIKSTFYDMFGDPENNEKGWRKYAFGDVAIIDTKMTKEFEKYPDLPHIGIDCIEKNTGKILPYQLIKDSSLISGKYIFDDRHIIYSKIRPNLNKVAMPGFSGLCSADAYPILPVSGKTNKYYLAYILRSEYFLTYILEHSGRTNIPKVNKQQLQGFLLPVPPISLQNQFAEIVTKVEEQKGLVQEAINESQYLFDSLMNECFK